MISVIARNGKPAAPVATILICMWVRLGSFSVKPDQVGPLRTRYNEVAVPRVRACAGNLGCLLLEPQSADEPFLVMTIWENRAAAEAYEASGVAADIVASVRAFFAGPPTLRSYESQSLAGLGDVRGEGANPP